MVKRLGRRVELRGGRQLIGAGQRPDVAAEFSRVAARRHRDLRSLRQRLKPLLARCGLKSSAVLWHGLAIRRYQTKLAINPAYRGWYENDAARWVRDHWAHKTVADQFALAHTASQIYELTEMLKKRLGPLGDAYLLDAGASDGFFLRRLGARNAVGVNFLAACAGRIRADGYQSCRADLDSLPFADRSFDYVICCETLEHVRNPLRVLDELARVCRRRLHLTIPWLPKTRINPRPAGWPAVESHIFEFSERDFAKVLTHSRMRLLYSDRIEVFPEPRNPLLRLWLGWWMYPNFFPRLQYYELEPVAWHS